MCIIELGRGKRLGGSRPIGFVISPEKSNLCGGESFFFAPSFFCPCCAALIAFTPLCWLSSFLLNQVIFLSLRLLNYLVIVRLMGARSKLD